MSNWERLKRVARVFFFMAVILAIFVAIFGAALGVAAGAKVAVAMVVGHSVGSFWMYAVPAVILACGLTVWIDFRVN